MLTVDARDILDEVTCIAQGLRILLLGRITLKQGASCLNNFIVDLDTKRVASSLKQRCKG
jgi:hypothetical protein